MMKTELYWLKGLQQKNQMGLFHVFSQTKTKVATKIHKAQDRAKINDIRSANLPFLRPEAEFKHQGLRSQAM